MSFHDSLKNLHRQAQQEAQARQEREREAARRRAEEVDFAGEMAGVTPLKSSGRASKPRRPKPSNRAVSGRSWKSATYFTSQQSE